MRNHASKIIASLTLGAASLARPVLARAPVAAPVAPAALEIQISSSQKQGKEYPTLGTERPVLLLIIRNISSKPVQLLEERSRGGFGNIHLEVTMSDGKTLSKPKIVAKRKQSGRDVGVYSIEILAPNQAIVREIRLHVPLTIRYPGTFFTQDEIKEKPDFNNSTRDEYFSFPFSKYPRGQIVAVKAVYEVPKAYNRGKIWTGRVESPLLTYITNWAVEY